MINCEINKLYRLYFLSYKHTDAILSEIRRLKSIKSNLN